MEFAVGGGPRPFDQRKSRAQKDATLRFLWDSGVAEGPSLDLAPPLMAAPSGLYSSFVPERAIKETQRIQSIAWRAISSDELGMPIRGAP